jgi:putative DNA primase/helicase
MLHDLRALARALGGEVGGEQVLATGPGGHSRKDRSLSVRLSPTAPDGFLAFSHARDDWRVCRERLGLPREGCQRPLSEVRIRPPQTRPEDDGRYRALRAPMPSAP